MFYRCEKNEVFRDNPISSKIIVMKLLKSDKK